MKLLVNLLVALVFAFLMAVIGVNWVLGCGEVFYFPNGTWETGECWIIQHDQVKGKW